MKTIFLLSFLFVQSLAYADEGATGGGAGGPPAKTFEEVILEIDPRIFTKDTVDLPTVVVPGRDFRDILNRGMTEESSPIRSGWEALDQNGNPVLVTPESYHFDTGTMKLKVGEATLNIKSEEAAATKQKALAAPDW